MNLQKQKQQNKIIAISLAAHFEKRQIRDIERYTAQAIRVGVIPGLASRATVDALLAPGRD